MKNIRKYIRENASIMAAVAASVNAKRLETKKKSDDKHDEKWKKAREADRKKKIKEDAGTSADGGMSAPFSAVGQEIDAKRKKKPIPLGKTMGSYVDEEMMAGSGAVAGLGVGPQGEPGRPPELMPMVKRGKPFLGVETYIVPSRVFNQIREAKRKGKHWRKYLDEDDTFHHIRMEAKKNKKGAIIIEDENTGALCFAKYGKEV